MPLPLPLPQPLPLPLPQSLPLPQPLPQPLPLPLPQPLSPHPFPSPCHCLSPCLSPCLSSEPSALSPQPSALSPQQPASQPRPQRDPMCPKCSQGALWSKKFAILVIPPNGHTCPTFFGGCETRLGAQNAFWSNFCTLAPQKRQKTSDTCDKSAKTLKSANF